MDNFDITPILNNLHNKFGIDCNNNNIPLLYALPKLHKNPYKFRFIAGAFNCFYTNLNINVKLGLKLIKSFFSNYCQKIYKRTGTNLYWSVDNSNAFVNKINAAFKKFGDIVSINTYDFSTLYTNLKHEEINAKLDLLIDLFFNNVSNLGKNLYCNVGNDKAFMSNEEYNGYIIFTHNTFKEAVHFIINNAYINFGGSIYKQICGIPMGGNSSSFIADLFLSYCEFDYCIKNLDIIQTNFSSLSYSTRYIDDICIINYTNFLNISSQIYPDSLTLNDESCIDSNMCNYLDVNVCLKPFHTKVYNKTDNFPFEVIALPHPDSCLHSKVLYNVVYSQTLRYLRICSDTELFHLATKNLYIKAMNKGYKIDRFMGKLKALNNNIKKSDCNYLPHFNLLRKMLHELRIPEEGMVPPRP